MAPAYAAIPGCSCTAKGSDICWPVELGKPAEEDKEAEVEVRRVCSSCGLVVLLYDPGSSRRDVGEPGAESSDPTVVDC